MLVICPAVFSRLSLRLTHSYLTRAGETGNTRGQMKRKVVLLLCMGCVAVLLYAPQVVVSYRLYVLIRCQGRRYCWLFRFLVELSIMKISHTSRCRHCSTTGSETPLFLVFYSCASRIISFTGNCFCKSGLISWKISRIFECNGILNIPMRSV